MKNRRSVKKIIKDAWRLFLSDMKYAKWAILYVVAYFAFLKRFLYSTCPVVMITGMPCPGCGMTRAAFRVLRLDFAGAWRVHPFIYPIILLAFLFCVERYLFLKKEMKVLKNLMIAVAVGMIVFYVWRVWKYFPGDPPMSYYHHNLIERIRNFF